MKVEVIHNSTANVSKLVANKADITIATTPSNMNSQMDYRFEYSNLTLFYSEGHPGHWNGVTPNILTFFIIICYCNGARTAAAIAKCNILKLSWILLNEFKRAQILVYIR